MNPYLIIAAICIWIGTGVAGYLRGAADVRDEWRTEIAEADAAALKAKAQHDKAARDKEGADAEHAMNLEAQHAKELEAVRNGSAPFINELSRRLRVAEARCVGGVVPSTTPDPSIPEGRTGVFESGYRGPDPASADRLRSVGLTLQAELRDCRAWVLKHGR